MSRLIPVAAQGAFERASTLPDRPGRALVAARWADDDAIIVNNGGWVKIEHSFTCDPLGGRELSHD
jgi:hypothetical protein